MALQAQANLTDAGLTVAQAYWKFSDFSWNARNPTELTGQFAGWASQEACQNELSAIEAVNLTFDLLNDPDNLRELVAAQLAALNDPGMSLSSAVFSLVRAISYYKTKAGYYNHGEAPNRFEGATDA